MLNVFHVHLFGMRIYVEKYEIDKLEYFFLFNIFEMSPMYEIKCDNGYLNH